MKYLFDKRQEMFFDKIGKKLIWNKNAHITMIYWEIRCAEPRFITCGTYLFKDFLKAFLPEGVRNSVSAGQCFKHVINNLSTFYENLILKQDIFAAALKPKRYIGQLITIINNGLWIILLQCKLIVMKPENLCQQFFNRLLTDRYQHQIFFRTGQTIYFYFKKCQTFFEKKSKTVKTAWNRGVFMCLDISDSAISVHIEESDNWKRNTVCQHFFYFGRIALKEALFTDGRRQPCRKKCLIGFYRCAKSQLWQAMDPADADRRANLIKDGYFSNHNRARIGEWVKDEEKGQEESWDCNAMRTC